MATGFKGGGVVTPNPATPKPKGPLETPHPVLQAAGFNGGIQAFNQRVQEIADAHHHAYGQLPSAGLTLDVAKSDVQPKDFPALFSVPKSPIVAQAQGTLKQHQMAHPEDYFITRPDGVMQVKTPFTDLAIAQHVTPSAKQPDKLTTSQLLKKYPMVQMGALPIPGADGLFRALRSLNAPTPQQTTGGLTPEQMLAMGRSPDVQISAAEEASQFGKSSLSSTPAAQAHDVTTIQQAQKELNKAMGTALPTTGVINDDWQKALSNWMRSADYFRKQLSFQASNAGFGNDVGAYVKAWHSKQQATSHGLWGQFLQAMPLPLFGHGGFWQDLGSLPVYLKGSSNNPLDIGLHGLTRTAGLTLDTVGGTVSQAKADLAAGTTFAAYMNGLHGGNYTYDEALAKARKQLHANPSWMRAFAGGFIPENETGLLKRIDQFTNVAGDLVLLRKPGFTGERVAAGDLATARNSTYLNTAARWAYQDLAKYGSDGIGRAASRLEGGQGSRALVARAAMLVKTGRMTPEQFAQHVAELYATGKTTITYDDRITGFHGLGEGPIEGNLGDKHGFFFIAHDEPFARAYAEDPKAGVFSVEARAKNPLVVKTKDQLDELTNKVPADTSVGYGGLARWAKSKGYDAVVIDKSATFDQRGFTIVLNPESARFTGEAERLASGKNLPTRVEVQGATLSSLRTAKLPTPGKVGQWLQEKKGGLRDHLDSYDSEARGANAGQVGRAPDLILTLRSAVAHAAPEGGRLGYFQDILPERVFNFVVKHKLGDDTVSLANKLESDLVRFQGKENILGIKSVEDKIRQLYHEKYGRTGTSIQDDPFKALIETEAPSVFKFPGGDERKAEDAFTSIGRFTNKVNDGLNKAAKIHARIILSGLNPLTGLGGFSLFWKHMVGDGLRAVVGGISSALTPEVRAARREIADLAANDPELSRRLGATLDRMRTGEANWALNRGGWNVESKSFRTGDYLDNTPHLNAAGEFLRRQLDSKALAAFQQGGTALRDLVLSDKTFRALWQSAKKANPQLSAEDYASVIEQRYKEIQDALSAKGLSFDDASAILNKNIGHDAGPALGDWIKENGLDFPVTGGQVETRGTFDDLTGRWVGNVIMRPNKFWRKGLGETVLSKHYAEFRKAGFDEKTALNVATDVAERTVKFHMLDFANRLQVEQDLRWLSYFATKHRLYFKWVLSTFARHPGYAAAVADFAHTLNQSGGITLPVTIFGQKWQVPAERLVWVPGREYDETSPTALAVWNFLKAGGNLDAAVKGAVGTNGNILTRSDTATRLGLKLLKIDMGKEGATYSAATAGLDKKTADSVRRAINEYQVEFYKDHGFYAPESQVVKSVLLHQLGQEYWRANLPLPIVPDTNRTDQQKLLAEYMALVDPKKRAKFLDQHPGFSDTFGVYDDPKKYLHNREYFQRWTSALDAYHAARRDLYAQAKKQGEWTTELEQKRRDLNASLQKTRQQLLVDDARSAGIDPHGGVPNGTTIPYGPWGKLVNRDPQFDPEHFLSALFPKLDKAQAGDIIGPLQKSLQNELSLLNDPQYVRASVQTPEEIKTLKREILQKIEVFKSYPTDALGKVRDVYQTKYVNKYWQTYDAKLAEIKNAPTSQRNELDSAFRAWRDAQDKPVDINGIKFPAPLRMAWATLDPKTRQERLSYLASKPASSLADYELDLLGVKHPPNVSTALAAIDKATQEYRDQYPGHSVGKAQLLQVAKEISKQRGYEGFYSYYVNTLTAPRVRQFQQTDLYRDMPAAVKSKFDQAILQPALQVAHDIKVSKSSTYYLTQWRKAMTTQIQPWLDAPDNKDLKDYLAAFGPNFLNELPGN